MINFDIFLLGLTIVSALTGLATEAAKKVVADFDKKYGSSVVAGILSIAITIGVSAAYMVLNNIAITPTTIVYVVTMTFLSWLCSTLGYDKVINVITQFKK